MAEIATGLYCENCGHLNRPKIRGQAMLRHVVCERCRHVNRLVKSPKNFVKAWRSLKIDLSALLDLRDVVKKLGKEYVEWAAACLKVSVALVLGLGIAGAVIALGLCLFVAVWRGAASALSWLLGTPR